MGCEEADKKKQQRLNKIAQEAAEQSHRQALPVVKFASEKELIAGFADYDAVLIAYEESAKARRASPASSNISTINFWTKIISRVWSRGWIDSKRDRKFSGSWRKALRFRTTNFTNRNSALLSFERGKFLL